jgi:branched-chain amino acid transport system substrate-binding protein
VVSYAKSQGINRIGAIAPRNAYGDAVGNALSAAAQKAGSRVVRLERYDPAATDFSPAVQSVASGGPGSLDAVMIAEGGQKLRSAASLLPTFQIDPVQVRLLGTGLWDDPTLGTEPALVGGWYAAPDPAARRDFEQRFESVYGRRPPRLATLAYDAAALAAVLARNGGPAPFDPLALTNPNGFAGVDGIFRLRPEGLVERGLSVMEITPSGNRVIDPAPSSFQALGF